MTSSPLLTPVGTAALVTLKRDGRPQLSNVSYAHDPETDRIRMSITDNRAKTRNLRRDPRASLYLTSPDLGRYLVLEGTVELSPVTRATDDATAEELVDLYRTIQGEHPDWAEYREAMIAEQRLVATFTFGHSYGWNGPG